MATLRELLGSAYKEGMTLEEAEKALASKRLADLSTGEYVSIEKYNADTKLLGDLQTQVNGKQAEIDAAVAAARAAAEKEYQAKLDKERNADKRNLALGKSYEGLSAEQKAVYDAFLKKDDLKLAEDGQSFSNFEELAKPIREQFKTLFPVGDDSQNRAGLAPAPGQTVPPATGDMFGFGFIPPKKAEK